MKEARLKNYKEEGLKNKVELAKEFATKKFQEAGTGNHFLEVYQILKDRFGVDDKEVLIAGLLHDTIEDTETTYEEISKTFSGRAADLVEEVSHPTNYNHEQKWSITKNSNIFHGAGK